MLSNGEAIGTLVGVLEGERLPKSTHTSYNSHTWLEATSIRSPFASNTPCDLTRVATLLPKWPGVPAVVNYWEVFTAERGGGRKTT